MKKIVTISIIMLLTFPNLFSLANATSVIRDTIEDIYAEIIDVYIPIDDLELQKRGVIKVFTLRIWGSYSEEGRHLRFLNTIECFQTNGDISKKIDEGDFVKVDLVYTSFQITPDAWEITKMEKAMNLYLVLFLLTISLILIAIFIIKISRKKKIKTDLKSNLHHSRENSKH
jgi:hypothetical protein